MARITPKTNWVAGNVPLGQDLNRMEGNSQQAFDELDTEVAARIADVNAEESARIADVNEEEARAIASENALQSQISSQLVAGSVGSLLFGAPNGVSATYSYGSTIVLGGGVNLLPAGINSSGDVFPSVAVSSGTWRCLGFSISTSYAYTLWIRIS